MRYSTVCIRECIVAYDHAIINADPTLLADALNDFEPDQPAETSGAAASRYISVECINSVLHYCIR